MTTTTTNVPAYQQLLNRLQTRLAAVQGQTIEKAGWVQLVFPNGHRIDVRKDKTTLPIVDTTVSPTELTVKTSELDKPNGRVQCFVPLSGTGPQALAILEKLIVEVAAAGVIPPKKRGAFKGSGTVDLFATTQESINAFEQSLFVPSAETVQILASDSSDD